ncbi:MAG: WD40 repeat domain-containing protein [Myxococcota bacterium]
MKRPAETFDVMWKRRDRALTWLTVLCSALFFSLAAWLPLSLHLQGPTGGGHGGSPADNSQAIWELSASAPATGAALAALVWALASLWIVRGAREEGEPPLSGAPLLILAIGGMLLADARAGWALLSLAGDVGNVWPWVLGWLVGGALFVPWRDLFDALSTDPGHRIERLWRLHGIAGRLLFVGTSGPLIALAVLCQDPTVAAQGTAPWIVGATLGMLSFIGLAVSALAVWTRRVGAGLDEARLVILDLPPQPAHSRFPGVAAILGGLTLAFSTLGVTPWPEARAVQEQLAEVGLAPPTDGRSEWLSLEEIQRRRLVTGEGSVRPVFSASGDQVAVTVRGANPGFWILDRRVSWLPQQERDLWDITELAISPGGEKMIVGRRSGLLQLRDFPRARTEPSWSEHRWDKIFSIGDRVQISDDAAFALGERGRLRRLSVSQAQWTDHLRLGHPVQSIALSPDGRALAGFWGSEQIGIWDSMGNLKTQTAVRGVRKLIWSPDGTRLYAVGQGIVEIPVDAPDEAVVRYTRPVADAALSADGRWMAIGDGGVRVLSLTTGQWLLHGQPTASGGVTGLAWHPDGVGLAVGTSAGVLELWWFNAHRWDVSL